MRCTQFYHVMFGLKKMMQNPVNISLSLSDAATAKLHSSNQSKKYHQARAAPDGS